MLNATRFPTQRPQISGSYPNSQPGNMDVTDIAPLLDKLDGDLAGLQAALKPLLSDLEGVSSKLPLLDRAKLQVLVAYAVESLLFCEFMSGFG